MWEKLKKMVRHNEGMTVCVILACAVCVWCYGCESKAFSLIEPGLQVTRLELTGELEAETARLSAELTTLQAKARLRGEQLDKQDELKAAILEIGLVVAKGGTINPVGAVVSLVGLLGIGAVVDNRKKDGIIKAKKPPDN